MNNRSISSEWGIHIWIGGDTFTQLLVSFQDTICIKDNTNIFFALSTDTSIHSQIQIHDFGLSSETLIHIRMGGVPFTKLWLYLLDSIFIISDTKIILHYPLILVFTLKFNEPLWYQFWMTYSYLDRWSNIWPVVSICTLPHIDNIWYKNFLCNIHCASIPIQID